MAMDCRLYLVTDDTLARGPADEVAARAALGGVTVVQLRLKGADGGAFLARAERLRARLAPLGVPVIVNDRLDVALAAGVAGVHLGQADLPCAAARRLAGPSFTIGVSVSTPDEARRAVADGADYLGVSPIFATPTKPDAPRAVGLAGVSAIRRAVRLPLVAIGGLHAGHAVDVIRAGADGVAVVSAIMAAENPEDAARVLRAAVDGALEERSATCRKNGK